MKKLFSLIICIFIIATLFAFSFTASAEIVESGVITVGSTPAAVGDTVTIPIKISENPGIMASTISITYDSKCLEYINYVEGYLKDYTVADHPDKNLIRFVSCEAKTRKNNGRMFSITFRVRDNAEWGFTKIDIKYSQGDFCNWDLDKIMPTIVSGGVDIAYNGSNCSHKNYSEWKTVAEPTCDTEGVMERICQKCNHVDSKKIASVGHTFLEVWTIEKEATADSPGTMVRYCETCNDIVDRIEYTVKDSQDGGFKNEIATDVPKNDVIEENFKEQYPNKEFAPVNPPYESKPSSSQSDNNKEETPSISDVIDSILGDTEEDTESGEKPTVIQKIAEVFDNFSAIENTFKWSLIILILLILI